MPYRTNALSDGSLVQEVVGWSAIGRRLPLPLLGIVLLFMSRVVPEGLVAVVTLLIGGAMLLAGVVLLSIAARRFGTLRAEVRFDAQRGAYNVLTFFGQEICVAVDDMATIRVESVADPGGGTLDALRLDCTDGIVAIGTAYHVSVSDLRVWREILARDVESRLERKGDLSSR